MRIGRIDPLAKFKAESASPEPMPEHADELSEAIERAVMAIPSPSEDPIQRTTIVPHRWRTIYAKMRRHRTVLERKGSLHYKDGRFLRSYPIVEYGIDGEPRGSLLRKRPIVLHFRVREEGRTRQKTIYIGTSATLVNMVAVALTAWRVLAATARLPWKPSGSTFWTRGPMRLDRCPRCPRCTTHPPIQAQR